MVKQEDIMRSNYYKFAKVNDNMWEGYGPGRVTNFYGKDAKTMDAWNVYVCQWNKKHPDSPIDRTDYFTYMIEEIW